MIKLAKDKVIPSATEDEEAEARVAKERSIKDDPTAVQAGQAPTAEGKDDQ